MGTSGHKTTGCSLLKIMKVIAAYIMAVVAGNSSPSTADVKKILDSVGIEIGDDASQLESLIEEMAGKDINEVLAAGHEKLKTVPLGGGGGGGGVGGMFDGDDY